MGNPRQCPVAVKILHPHIAAHLGTDRFLREIQIADGYGHKEWIKHDSDLDSLRDLPRFQKLLEAV